MGARAYGEHRPTVTLDGDAVRRLLRLWRHLHAPAEEPADRKRRLIIGLCDLLGASGGTCVVTVLNPDSGQRDVVSVVRATTGRKELSPVPWHDSPGSAALLEVPRGGHLVESSLALQRDPTVVATLMLARGPGGGSFTAQAVAVLRLVHEQCGWLYSCDRGLASPRVRRLPELRRYVLQYLVAGEAEADVADWLGVGVRTVRSEAAAAYKALGVANREALVALWSESQS